jgi:hypothetical protein
MASRNEIEGFAPQAVVRHEQQWSRALDDAVAKAIQGMEPGTKQRFRVEFEVEVVRANPGWVGGYKVILVPGEG